MTTAELIKKREEEKNNPKQTVTPSIMGAPKPVEGLNMAEARMAGNSDASSESSKKPLNTPLYDAGVSLADVEKEAAVKNPITSPEYERFRNEVIGAQQFGVETEEQRKARERRDFIKQGLTGFTEGLSALANLYYTTKGAPSQKLTSQMPEISKRLYAERLERDKKLENFRAWQRSKADKDADRAYQEKVRAEDLAFRQDQAKENLRRWQLEFDEAVKRNATQEELRRLELNLRQAQQEFDNTIKQQTLAETQRHNIAMETNAAEKISGSSTGSKKGSKMATINTPKGAMDVDFGRVNETTLNQLYQRVPKDVKAMYELDVLDDDKVRQSKMRQAIDHALQSSEGFSDWFEIAGLGSYQKTSPQASVTEQQPKAESKGGKSLGDIGFIKSTKSNANAAPQPTYTETANVSATEEAVEVPKAPTIEEEVPGNKYERMLAKDKRKAEKDREETQKRIDEALAKTAKSVDEAKAKRAELNSILNNELAEFDIEAFIKDNNIGHWDARKFRMEYADDEKKRASIKRQLERLNEFINNR